MKTLTETSYHSDITQKSLNPACLTAMAGSTHYEVTANYHGFEKKHKIKPMSIANLSSYFLFIY